MEEAQLYLPEHRHIAISVEEVLQNPGKVHDLIREKMAYVYHVFEDQVEGWLLETNEHDDVPEDFLLLVEFVFDENDSVTLIYRAHDLYTVGHLDENRHAFLLNQGRMDQLRNTRSCLARYGIRSTIMRSLGDSYTAMESTARIQRMDLEIGQEGFRRALHYLLRTNPLTHIRRTAFSYLYLVVFVCEGMRILYVRASIINTFAGVGMPVPEHLLQYLYGWAAASYILEAYSRNDEGPLNFYGLIADYGRMDVEDMSWTYPLIKYALQPRSIDTNMVDLYQDTVDQFHRNMLRDRP